MKRSKFRKSSNSHILLEQRFQPRKVQNSQTFFLSSCLFYLPLSRNERRYNCHKSGRGGYVRLT